MLTLHFHFTYISIYLLVYCQSGGRVIVLCWLVQLSAATANHLVGIPVWPSDY